MKRRDFLMTTLAAGAWNGAGSAEAGPCPQGPEAAAPLTEQASALFPGFESRKIPTTGATINVRRGGSGPPLLLIHGYPQTHALWARIAPRPLERAQSPRSGVGLDAISRRETAVPTGDAFGERDGHPAPGDVSIWAGCEGTGSDPSVDRSGE